MRIVRHFFAAAAMALCCGSVWAQAPETVEKAAKASIRRLQLQLDLPRDAPPDLKFQFTIPSAAVWVALVCAVALVLYVFRDVLTNWRLQRGDEWGTLTPDQAGEILTQQPDDPVLAADALSSAGRFVEAMHMLLLQSLAEIRHRLGEQFADSLTSREILRGARLSGEGRASLREIVAGVEWTYFGGRPATLADYAACRRSFETLRRALRDDTSR